jgi:hypothetical protein
VLLAQSDVCWLPAGPHLREPVRCSTNFVKLYQAAMDVAIAGLQLGSRQPRRGESAWRRWNS